MDGRGRRVGTSEVRCATTTSWPTMRSSYSVSFRSIDGSIVAVMSFRPSVPFVRGGRRERFELQLRLRARSDRGPGRPRDLRRPLSSLLFSSLVCASLLFHFIDFGRCTHHSHSLRVVALLRSFGATAHSSMADRTRCLKGADLQLQPALRKTDSLRLRETLY